MQEKTTPEEEGKKDHVFGSLVHINGERKMWKVGL